MTTSPNNQAPAPTSKRKPLDFDHIHESARGRWLDVIYPALGIRFERVPNRHQPCPMCGGHDRFRCDNKDGSGTWICSHCGAGDGFKLIEQYTSTDRYGAMAAVADVLGIDTSAPITQAQRDEWARQSHARQQAENHARQQAQAQTAQQAVARWNQAQVVGISAYLERKRIGAVGVRFDGDSVLVPIIKPTTTGNTLVNLQTISADGTKLFMRDGEIKGCYCPLYATAPSALIFICEGYATGVSIYQAFHGAHTVIVAFNAGNLEPVAIAIRQHYPSAQLIICADNDSAKANEMYTRALADGKQPTSVDEFNTGIIKAQQAARAVGALVVAPHFNNLQGAQ